MAQRDEHADKDSAHGLQNTCIQAYKSHTYMDQKGIHGTTDSQDN